MAAKRTDDKTLARMVDVVGCRNGCGCGFGDEGAVGFGERVDVRFEWVISVGVTRVRRGRIDVMDDVCFRKRMVRRSWTVESGDVLCQTRSEGMGIQQINQNKYLRSYCGLV